MELTLLSKEKTREIIAKRAAMEFKSGDVVTLGIGLPTEVANYIPENKHVIFQSENGLLGVGKNTTGDKMDKRITNAGGVCVEGEADTLTQQYSERFRLMKKAALQTG